MMLFMVGICKRGGIYIHVGGAVAPMMLFMVGGLLLLDFTLTLLQLGHCLMHALLVRSACICHRMCKGVDRQVDRLLAAAPVVAAAIA